MNRLTTLTLAIALAVLLPAAAHAYVLNPAYAYCQALGYPPSQAPGPSGGDYSYCLLPNGQLVGQWEFFQGLAGNEYSYCAIHNLSINITNASRICSYFGVNQCTECVFPNGTAVETTALMGLSFGGGSGPGSWICQRTTGGACGAHCTLFEDPECYTTQIAIGAIAIIIVAYILFIRKKKPEKKPPHQLERA